MEPKVIILVLISIFCVFGSSEGGARVVGGHDAPTEKFTWVARLENENQMLMCSGALIHRRFVLVPKQCVSKAYQIQGLKVILGDYNRVEEDEEAEQHIMVKKVMKHYNKKTKEPIDVAILALNESAKLNDYVSVIKMAAKGVPFGTQLKLTGWGIKESGGNASHVAEELQVATTAQATTRNCTGEELKPRKSESCMGVEDEEYYVGPCHGDEGGSVALRDITQSNNYLLQGLVVQTHDDCPSDKRYAVYVSVPRVRYWIINRIGCHMPGTWTELYDTDNPKDKNVPPGDFERAHIIKPCGEQVEPLCARVEPNATGACSDMTSRCARRQRIKANRWGLACDNRKQAYYMDAGRKKRCFCCDYSIQFKCPN